MILVDNTLQDGEVADPAATEHQVTGDRGRSTTTPPPTPGSTLVLLPVGDGLTLARRH